MKIQITSLTILLLVVLALPVQAQHHEYQLRYYNLEEGLDSKFYSGSNFGVSNPVYSAYPVTNMVRHNRVDGLFLGIKENRMNWSDNNILGLDNLNIHGLFGYSFGLNEPQYMIGFDKNFGDYRKWLMIGAEYHNTTATQDYWRTGMFENSISSFTAGFDYHDYHKVDGYGVYSLLRLFPNLEVGISYNEDEFSSLEISTDYSIFDKYSYFRANPAIDEHYDQINQQSVTLGLTINPDKMAPRSFVWTTISAKAELADVGNFHNDFNYNKFMAEAKSYVRLDRSSLLKWRLMAGSITGEAPDFKNFALGGIGTMRAFGYKFFQGNEMLLSNIEMEFGKKSSYKNGWADLSSIYVSLFFDSGFSRYNEKLYSSQDPLKAFHQFKFSDLSHNAGVGLGIGMVRFEMAKPIAGNAGNTAFWIRLNPTF